MDIADNSLISALFKILPASGSIFNAALIILGTVIGLTVGKRLPERLAGALMSSIGVFIMYLGFGMASSGEGTLNMLASFVGGTAIGELMNIHAALERFGEWARRSLKMSDERFGEAMISSSLVFCTGSLAILGSIEDGLGEFPSILIAKSVIDGASSIVFAVSLGAGTAFSALAVLIYQGAITFAASAMSQIMSPHVINSMTAVGGLMVICIGLNLIGAAKIRTSNQLPGIVIAAVLAALF